MKKFISMVLVCVSLLTMLYAAYPVTASAATTQSLDAVKGTQVTIKHVKSGLFVNVPYGNYAKNPKIILWPDDYSWEQIMLTKFYGDNSMRILFDENTNYCVDIFSPSRKLRAGLIVDSWKVSPSEDMYQLFVPYIVPGKDDVVIFRMKSNMNLALGAKKTTKNTVLELMPFKESDSRLYFQFCDTKYKTIDLAATTATTNTTMKPMANGISATVSTTAIKHSESVTVKVNLDATALTDQVTVKIGNVTKSVKPSVIANRIGQQASVTFKGSELGSSAGHPVTVTATNKAGSVSVSLAKVKVSMAFVNPLKAINGGKTNIVTQGFGSNTYNPSKDHLGVDYSGSASYVVAICDGTVVDIYTGYGYGYGNTVVLRHVYEGVEYYTLYGHMANSLKVKRGDVVSAGQRLGTMSSTGESSGDHVHVSVFTGNYKPGKTIPAGYYPGLFTGICKKYKDFTFYDAQQLIKTGGSVLK